MCIRDRSTNEHALSDNEHGDDDDGGLLNTGDLDRAPAFKGLYQYQLIPPREAVR